METINNKDEYKDEYEPEFKSALISNKIVKIDNDYLQSSHMFEKYLNRIRDIDFDNFKGINLDILMLVTEYLDIFDTIRLSMVCKSLYFYITDDIFIRKHFDLMMVLILNQVLPKKIIWKKGEKLDFSIAVNNTVIREVNEALLLISYFLMKQKEFNYYSVIVHLNYIVDTVSYCSVLVADVDPYGLKFPTVVNPVSVFIKFIYFLHDDQEKIINYMRLRAVFIHNEIKTIKHTLGPAIKLSSKITDDFKCLIFRIKIGFMRECVNNECFIHEYILPKISVNKKSYYLYSNTEQDESCECFLPKNKLVDEIVKSLKSKSTTLVLRFDISVLTEFYEWMLLYEFMLKLIFYKAYHNVSPLPKIYYGTIKNDEVIKLFKELIDTSKNFIKLIRYFDNYKQYVNYNKKQNYKCYYC